MDMGHLAQLKKGTVVHGGDFIDVVENTSPSTTDHWGMDESTARSHIPRWLKVKGEDWEWHVLMKQVLQAVREDAKVLEGN